MEGLIEDIQLADQVWEILILLDQDSIQFTFLPLKCPVPYRQKLPQID